jgi:hypothetical protein
MYIHTQYNLPWIKFTYANRIWITGLPSVEIPPRKRKPVNFDRFRYSLPVPGAINDGDDEATIFQIQINAIQLILFFDQN